MRRALLGICGLIVGVLIGDSAALAAYSNTIRLAIGARQAGMGGTCRSIADDGTAPFCNPAGMAFQEGKTLNLDGGLILAHPHYEDPQNESRSGGAGAAGVGGFPDFGFTHKIAGTPFAYGIGSYTYSAIRMKYDINSTLLVASGSETSDFDFNLIHQRIIPSLAFQVTDYLSVGGGFVFAYQTFSQKTPYQFQSSVRPATLTGVNYFSDFNTDGWGEGGVFGALLKLGDKTRIGASYTTRMAVKLKGRDEVTLRNNPGLIPFGINDKDRSNYHIAMTWKWPQVLGVGISHEPRKDLLLAFDWQWIDWSAAADQLDFLLSEGNNATVNGVVGNGGNIRDGFKQNARDAFVYHFGVEYKPKDNLALRAGYVYSTNPVPDKTLTPLFNGNFQHTISLGLGTKLVGWDVDSAWSHTFLHEQVLEVSGISGGEYNNSQTSNGADVFFLSLRKRF